MARMIVAGLAAFVCALALQPIVLAGLRRAGMVDVPNARSSHQQPVHRGGGIAVVAGVVAGLLTAALRGGSVFWGLLGVTAGFAVVGLLDDRFTLSVGRRLVTQLALSAGTVGIVRSRGTRELQALPWPVLLAVLAGLAVWIVAYTNAFNFMDGVNAISALNAALAGLVFGWLGTQYGVPGLPVAGLAVAGAALGFLPWNAPVARVFLGDVGSYGLGAAIATMAVWGVLAGVPLVLAVSPLVLYGVDTGVALLLRLVGHRPWRDAHREHVYQRLTDAGLSHVTTAGITVLGAAAVVLVLDVAVQEGAATWGVAGAAVISAGYLALPRLTAGRAPLPVRPST